MNMKALILLFTIIVNLFSGTTASAATILAVHGGGFILNGTETVSEPEWSAVSRPTFAGETRFWSFLFTGPESQLWGISLGIPHDQTSITPGMYLGVKDVDLVTWGPSLSVTGHGQGANTHEGWFNILQWESNPLGGLTSAAVDFQWGREGSPTGITGSLRFNSDMPITVRVVPEPTGVLIYVIPIAGIFFLRKRWVL